MFFVCVLRVEIAKSTGADPFFLLLGSGTGVRLSGLWGVKGRRQVLLEALYI